MAPFAFSQAQADAIRGALRRFWFADADIDRFIEFSNIDVKEWLERWPPLNAEQLREGRRRLENLRKHLDDLHYALHVTDDAHKFGLWDYLIRSAGVYGLDGMMKEARNGTSYMGQVRLAGLTVERQVDGLRDAVGDVLDTYSMHNGRNGTRKQDLAYRVAGTFHVCFGELPATTPTGAYMEAMRHLADAIGERIGKDAVGRGLKLWLEHRAFTFRD